MIERDARVEVALEDTPILVFDAVGTTGNCDGVYVSVRLDEEFGGDVRLLPANITWTQDP